MELTEKQAESLVDIGRSGYKLADIVDQLADRTLLLGVVNPDGDVVTGQVPGLRKVAVATNGQIVEQAR